MYEFYQKKHAESVLKPTRKELRKLYDQLPPTTGCMENMGTCKAWCCQIQNPQVMFVEFQNTWNSISNSWPKEKLIELVGRCIRNYLTAGVTKSCVFWDRESGHCMQHKTRPFNCRIYGQVPEEEFKPRYERLKVLYENDPTADIRPQCNLVKTQGDPPTMAESDMWFKWLKEIEAKVIPDHYIHYNEGGSYRTYHDHILLSLCGQKVLAEMTKIKTTGTPEEKEAYVQKMMEKMRLAEEQASGKKG